MMIRVVMFSAIFFAAASVPAAAETGDDGGRLVIGQGANSCWAWTRSHEAKAATQGLYTQWVAGFVSGVSWEADDPDILRRMDFDGLMAWMHDYCKANPLAKVTTGAAMLVQELRARRQGGMRRRICGAAVGKISPAEAGLAAKVGRQNARPSPPLGGLDRHSA